VKWASYIDLGNQRAEAASPCPATRSWPYLRHNLLHDLAALNKVEMILWDSWGLMDTDQLGGRSQELLDQVARVTTPEQPDFSELRRLYDGEPAPRVPATVTSYSPLDGEARAITLAPR
jgi:hypothetical protein